LAHSYKQLDDKHQEAMLNLFIAPLDLLFVGSVLKQMPILSATLIARVQDFLAKAKAAAQ